MSYFELDFETYSPQPLGNQKSVGAYRYASDPEAEILVMAISKDGGHVHTWDLLNGGDTATHMLADAINADALIYAHNAGFEAAVCKYLLKKTFGIDPPKLPQWRCTAAMARLAAIPSSLEGAGEFLDIDMPKDKEGTRLINLFCKPRTPSKKDPRTRILPGDQLVDWAKFVAYCRRDVEAEAGVLAKLKDDFPLEGWALRSFQADLEMNDRGIPVNRAALEHASALMTEFLAKMVPVFRSQVADPGWFLTLPITTQRKAPKEVDISVGFNPTQGELFKVWLAGEGFPGNDLQADTVEYHLNTPSQFTGRGRKALYTYSLIASAAVKKIPAMLAMACEDGYVRGALMVFGAERTHRWTGKGIQPQNYARPRIKFTELAYDMICGGASLDEIESICGNFFDVLVSVIRHFIQPHEGDCLQADYSSIEARVAPWLVNAQPKLDLFEAGEPIYEIMATRIFGGEAKDIDTDQRFIGKQAELGCTYNMGAPKFRGTCESYGFVPSPEMVEEYKPRHKGMVMIAFSNFKARKIEATQRQGREFKLTDERLMELMINEKGWGGAVLGADGLTPARVFDPVSDKQWAHLTYDDLAQRAVTAWREANPVIVAAWRALDDGAKAAINSPRQVIHVGKLSLCYKEVAGFNALLVKLPSGHKLVYPHARVVKNTSRGWGTTIEFWGVIPNSGGKWGWCSTYGGKILENATQACAGDVMRHGMECAASAGYAAFMLVHDEILTLMKPGQTHQELCALLCELAPWMKGLPLAAEGNQLPFYKK